MIIFANGKYIDKIKKKFYYLLYNFYNTDVYMFNFLFEFFSKDKYKYFIIYFA